MLIRRKRRRRRRSSSPNWFKYGLVIFIGIMLISQFIPKPPPPEAPPTNAAMEPAEAPAVSFIDTKPYADVLSSLTKAPKLTDVEIGKGPLLLCGQEAEIRLRTHLAGMESEAEQPAKTLRFRVGASDVSPLFDRGVTGMQVGGKRLITLSAPVPLSTVNNTKAEAEEAEPMVTVIEVELVDATPNVSSLFNAQKQLPLKLFDQRLGAGPAAICSDVVEVHVTLWKADGTQLFTTKDEDATPLHITIGVNELPLGLEQSLIGMKAGSVRTIIIPPAWQKQLQNSLETPAQKRHKLPLPQTTYVIADIERVEKIQKIEIPENTESMPYVEPRPQNEPGNETDDADR